mmetsp:Transcript_114426/g.323482  ORF Transcript_114426/g.323482 Transcript_114426/m.323482 type:complete len:516 (-) Transcript_114426:121-1668(-)
MRLRLRCSSAYALGDFQWAMVHVPEHALSVGDFAGHVSRLLELNLHGGDGELPQLLLDGFLVPHGEELRVVLRDDEVVDVERSDRIAGFGGATAAFGASSKRALEAPPSNGGVAGHEASARDAKRQRGGAAQMALGWQPPDVSSGGTAVIREDAAAAQTKQKPHNAETPAAVASTKGAATKALTPGLGSAQDTSSSSSDDEEPQKTDPKPREQGMDAATRARQAALATCQEATATPKEAVAGADVAAGEVVRSLFVRGLPPQVGSEALKKHFSRYGAVESANVSYANNGRSRGFGFVDFVDPEACKKLVLSEGTHLEVEGKTVEIRPKESKGGGKAVGAKGGKDGKGAKGGKATQSGKDAKGGRGGKNGKVPAIRRFEQEETSSSSDDDEDDAPVAKLAQAATPAPAVTPASASTPVPAVTPASAATPPAAPATASAQTEMTPAPAESVTAAPQKRRRAERAAPPVAEGAELELQKQMAALGLPVSFTASERPGEDESDEDGDEDEEDESEEADQ